MTYTVEYIVKGRYSATVEASSREEALKKADEAFCETEFTNLEDIEGVQNSISLEDPEEYL